MDWNWKHKEWPEWQFDPDQFRDHEATFLRQAGLLEGIWKHLSSIEKNISFSELLISEASSSSLIEGEVLLGDSLRSSIQYNLGLSTKKPKNGHPQEEGMAELMTEQVSHFRKKIDKKTLDRWHKYICGHQKDISRIGSYRTHKEPMQIVSGPLNRRIVSFEAPPSRNVSKMMTHLLKWISSCDHGPLLRSSIAHLHFLAIHPFEDGNGRIARAISERVLSRDLGHPCMISLSMEIEASRKKYYKALQSTNTSLRATDFLNYFIPTILAAQKNSIAMFEFTIYKNKAMAWMEGQVNGRQKKVMLRMYREGPGGFQGGLTSGKYQKIAKTSAATALRDMIGLAELGLIKPEGEKKGRRYILSKGFLYYIEMKRVEESGFSYSLKQTLN